METRREECHSTRMAVASQARQQRTVAEVSSRAADGPCPARRTDACLRAVAQQAGVQSRAVRSVGLVGRVRVLQDDLELPTGRLLAGAVDRGDVEHKVDDCMSSSGR